MNYLSTSDLWDTQESVFTGKASPRALKWFAPLVASLRLFGPNNLLIRNDICTGDLKSAFEGFRKLCIGGRYAENLSYLKNCDTGFIWANVDRLSPEIANLIQRQYWLFKVLSAPTGEVATPETRNTDLIAPPTTPFYQDDQYTVLRPRAGVYIIIHHNQDVFNWPRNKHVNPDSFGHIAIWIDGVWVAKHPFYEGYEAKKKNPPRYNTIYDFKRWYQFGKPKVSVEKGGIKPREIRIQIGNAERVICWRDNLIVWSDSGPGISWLNGEKCDRVQRFEF